MGRILAIDYGRKRVGLAVTDPLQIIANALKTVETKEIWNFLEDYLKKEEVECIVIGYPRQLNNQVSDSVRYINPFLGRLRKLYPNIDIKQVDERFTSKIAHQTMRDAGLKKKARQNKALVDTISATIILQSYLEQRLNY
ncbi:MAG: Holliday junction resolvase RuvX [Bacteroidales bacterium]|nr:Holliday junction resolvase RuvX [Bacteroidales bacterium]